MRSTICIDEIEVKCIIGILDRERIEPQVVRVDLELEVDFERASRSDGIDDTWNYAEICDQVGFILQQGRFWLLESAVWAIVRHLLLPPVPGDPRPPIVDARVMITKFGVLPGRARPRVTLADRAEAQTWSSRTHPWGAVETVAAIAGRDLYRLHIEPGRTVPGDALPAGRGVEMVVSGELSAAVEGEAALALAVGDQWSSADSGARSYRNDGDRTASLICFGP